MNIFMGNSFYNDDELEEFLKQQANNHRMYPSDKVWRNIQESLHGNMRWPALGFFSVLIISALVVGTLIIEPGKKMIAENYLRSTKNTQPVILPQDAENAIILTEHFYPAHITQQTIQYVSRSLSSQQNQPPQEATAFNQNIVLFNNSLLNTSNLLIPASTLHALPVSKDIILTNRSKEKYIMPRTLLLSTAIESLKLPAASNYFQTKEEDIWRSFPLFTTAPTKQTTFPFDFEFYITPSVSYRKWVYNDENTKQAPSLKQMVHHAPAMGIETGFSLNYHLNKAFTLKAGLQFNMRKYNLDAYRYTRPTEIIPDDNALNNDVADTTSTYYIAQSVAPDGSKKITLSNSYYQISLPIGVDWRVVNISKKLSWNIGVAVQPTYTFDKTVYAIDNDLKTYTNANNRLRNWNVNANAETFLRYKKGDMSWQIGPQFRYQMLPTLSGSSPVKEYLFDYGVKVGFIKTLSH